MLCFHMHQSENPGNNCVFFSISIKEEDEVEEDYLAPSNPILAPDIPSPLPPRYPAPIPPGHTSAPMPPWKGKLINTLVMESSIYFV